MFWGLLYLFGNVTDQLIIGYLLAVSDPFAVIPVFYAIGTVSCFLAPALMPSQRISLRGLFTERGLLTLYLVSTLLANGLWFSSVFFIGLGSTSVAILPLRVISMLYALKILKEPMTSRQLVASAFVIGGLAFFISAAPPDDLFGLGLALFCILCFSVEVITHKHLALKVDGVSLVFLRQLIQLIAFSIGITLLVGVPDFSALGEKNLYWFVIAAGVLGGFVVKIADFHANRVMPLSRFTILASLKPVFIVLASVSILGERMTVQQGWAAAVMLLGSFFLFRFERRQEASPYEPSSS